VPVRSPSSNLDFLRSIAVLLVLAEHICHRLYVDQIGWMSTNWGIFGVLLFFVHTCLVLMYSMQRSELTGWPLLGNFSIRRIFRIYPLSILTVAAALVLHLDSDINGIRGLSHGPFPGKVDVVSNLLLAQNLTYSKSIVNVLWSLPFELQMYVVLPFIFMWIRGKRMFWPLLGLWIASVGAALLQPHVHGLGRLSIAQFLPNFLPGVIAFSLPHIPRIKSWLWPIFVFVLVILSTLSSALWLGWVLCLFLGVLIPFFAEIKTKWLRWTSNRIATYSYGIYLSHQFSIWIAFGVFARHSYWIKVPALLALLVSLPVFLYHFIEKPMIDLGFRLSENLSRPQSVRSTAAV
jgi:peptidoglycan/LPS O-acetylase OafA/YrhL